LSVLLLVIVLSVLLLLAIVLSVLFLLAIVLSVLLPITAFDYYFCIFKPFLMGIIKLKAYLVDIHLDSLQQASVYGITL
jgi:hypothetical protein